VLLNLINNAIKYNHSGGVVKLDIDVRENESGGEPLVHLSVVDTGVGISESDLPKIFTPFERIGAERTDTEGTGLGLSVVKKLMDVMGGEIRVNSQLGKGSSFTIVLPQCMSQIEIARQGGEFGGRDAHQELTHGSILYIEDNSSNVELVEQILHNSRPDIRLFTTKYGSQALQLAHANHPDLILLDLNLPDMHGSEVLKQLQLDAMTRSIPVIVISADAMPKQIEALIKGGAKNYLTKPLGIMAFLKEVDLYVN
jgi:CheY-like chemotaxis protein/anti-sigma regulatory factor (Ser/Thr protein kinase)